MTKDKVLDKKSILSAGLVIITLNILTLLTLTGCISDDLSKISIGIINKINLVSPWGTESIDENKQRILELIDLVKKYDVNMVLKRRVKSIVDCFALKPLLEPINKPIYKDMGVKRAVS